ncbi:MAG: YIP1 family protein [Acidobacteria bacterium]|nr:YIP1 family protein [Acidobacteriota bacterium]
MVNRTHAYIVFGVGILLIIAAAVLKVPIGIGPGAALAFLGLALFGLSFIPLAAAPAEPPPPMSFPAKLAGIFFEPSSVFRNLRAHPRWLAALVLTSLLAFAYATAFVQRLTPERIVNFTNDKVAERFNLPPEQMAQAKADQIADAKSPAKTAGRAVTTFVFSFFMAAVLAGLYVLAVLLFGGRLGFWQALAVWVWAAVPVEIIRTVLSLVLLYIKDPDDIHPVLGQGGLVTDNLGILVRSAEHPVFFAILSFFGVLSFYRLWLTATGLRHASDKLSSGSAWAIAIIFWLIGMLMLTAFSALFGGIMS